MFNHHRGLWGYTGTATEDGQPLTVQATGIGGQSLSAVTGELCDLGLEAAVRIGTSLRLDDSSPRLGEPLLVDRAFAVRRAGGGGDGPGGPLLPDTVLTTALASDPQARLSPAPLLESDGLDRPPVGDRVQIAGAVTDLSTARLLDLAASRGLSAAAISIVAADPLLGELPDSDLERTVERVGAAAVRALGRRFALGRAADEGAAARST